jgi:hypothetical protein
MQVIRFELYDGRIVYTHRVQNDALRDLMKITQGAYRATAMELNDAEYYRLPLLAAVESDRQQVSRWGEDG